MNNVTWHLYSCYDIILTFTIEIHIWNQPGKIVVLYHPTHSYGHASSWYVCLWERAYFIYLKCNYNTWYVCDNTFYGPERRSSSGNKWSNTRFRSLFLDLLIMGWIWCASAMGVIKPPPSPVSPKTLRSQFIYYYMCNKGVFVIDQFKFCCRCNKTFLPKSVEAE